MKLSFLFLIFILLAMPIINAEKIVNTQVGGNLGLSIEYPKIFNIAQFQNYTFDFHVFNSSNGVLVTNTTTSCTFHLYDNEGKYLLLANTTGGALIVFKDGSDFEVFVNGNNFTRLGDYGYIFECNSSNNWGGFASIPLQVTSDGYADKDFPEQFFIIIIGLIFITLGIFNERMRLLKYSGSIIFMVMGVLVFYPGFNFINWTTLFGKLLGTILITSGFYFLIEDAFSKDVQEGSYNQYREEDED